MLNLLRAFLYEVACHNAFLSNGCPPQILNMTLGTASTLTKMSCPEAGPAGDEFPADDELGPDAVLGELISSVMANRAWKKLS